MDGPMNSAFNSRYLGLSFEAHIQRDPKRRYRSTFNSRYLGLSFEASLRVCLLGFLVRLLSIPVTWDYPLKRSVAKWN